LKNKIFLQTVIISLCLLIILRYFSQHTGELAYIFQLQSDRLLIIFLLSIAIHVLLGYKMLIILRKLGLRDVLFTDWFKIFSVSRFVNFHVTQGGNLFRSYILKTNHQFPYTQSIGMISVFGWLEAIFFFLMSIGAIAIQDHRFQIKGFNAIGLLTGLLAIFLLIPLLSQKILQSHKTKNPWLLWAQRKLCDIVDSFMVTMRDLRLLTVIISLNLLTFMLFACSIFIAFGAIEVHLNFAETTLFTALTLLSNIFFITPSNLGVTEVIYGYLSTVLGNSAGGGIIVCATLRLIWYILYLLLSVIFYRTLLGAVKKND
jgi:uncharacterized protein (TIRG00374 family)